MFQLATGGCTLSFPTANADFIVHYSQLGHNHGNIAQKLRVRRSVCLIVSMQYIEHYKEQTLPRLPPPDSLTSHLYCNSRTPSNAFASQSARYLGY